MEENQKARYEYPIFEMEILVKKDIVTLSQGSVDTDDQFGTIH